MRSLPIFAALMIVVGGFTYWGSERAHNLPRAGESASYFTTPQESVDVITRLLQSRDWATLASYYDLSGTDIDWQSLSDGRFFLAARPPEAARSAEGWRHTVPFPPGSRFQSARYVGNNEVEVTVSIDRDDGNGTVQRSLGTFRLKAHPEGYQLVPKTRPASETADGARP